MRKKLLSLFTLALLASGSAWAQETYQIGTAEELEAFALKVNEGENDANAVLTADIDYSAFSTRIGLGEGIDGYLGTFDGQGHKITVGFTQVIEEGGTEVSPYATLFFNLLKGSVVKNLITDGTITTNQKFAAGIAGDCAGLIENCASYVTIESSLEGDGTHGGIAGRGLEGGEIKFCLSAVKINGEKTNNCGTLVGWLTGKTTIYGCVSVAEMNLAKVDGSDCICRNNANMTAESGRNYFLNQYGSFNTTYCAQASAAALKSGAVCWALNGRQEDIHWYQTLGTDNNPVPFATSKQVYAKCDNIDCTGKCTGDVSYANEPTGCKVADHEYVLGVCEVCGTAQEGFCEEIDGVYQIDTPAKLKWFGNQVAAGNNAIKGVLLNDIDFTEYGKIVTTGDFYGELDGQFHTLTIKIDDNQANPAPILNLYGTVKNLKVVGSIAAGTQKFAAAIAAHTYQTAKVYNCTASIDITTAVNGDGTHAGLVAVNESGLDIRFCIFNGSMKNVDGAATANSGGIVGWSSGATTMVGCIFMPTDMDPGIVEYTGSRNVGNLKAQGCYYVFPEGVDTGGTGINDGFEIVDEATLASGEMCYLMNGDQSMIGWTQNIGTDAWPNNEGKASQVYTTAERRCDGQLVEGAEGTYTNDESAQAQLPDHGFVDGICVVCGAKEPGFMEPNADGFYEITDGKQLVWFASAVNRGEKTIKAILVNDIDMGDYNEKFRPIGCTDATPFGGVFDGQFHVISNLIVNQEDNFGGLFGVVEAPVTIKNLVLDASCSITGGSYTGLVGESKAVAGDVILENLGNEGKVKGLQNTAGIFGCCMSSSATIKMTNCYVTGQVDGGSESALLSGWFGGAGTATNCWTVGNATGISDGYPIGRGTCTYKNCYATGDVQGDVKQVAASAVASGELAYLLNGSTFQNPVWYQTVGEDLHPVWDNTHGVVYCANGEYADVHDDASLNIFFSAMLESEQKYCEDVVAQKTLVEEYAAAFESLNSCSTMEEFSAAYTEVLKQKDPVIASADAYAAYQDKLDRVHVYLEEHPDLQGDYLDILVDYLETETEPCDEYPNGASQYILANLLLDNDQLAEESALVDVMLQSAIRGGIAPGTDVTNLLANPTFVDGFGGWEGKVATGSGASETSPIRGAECYAKEMDMYQTIEVDNGVYELQINGAFRAYQDPKALGYAATFYLNDVQNYFQMDIEDMISMEDVNDGVNCNITGPTPDLAVTDGEGDEVQTIGYVMHGVVSCCNAFNAGRYPNSILVEVTDGKLTVGIKKPKTSTTSSDWLGFGNLKLVYRGTPEEAAESYDNVLACMNERANTILNKYVFSTGEDYNRLPNFSQAIKDELQATMDAVPAAADVQAKYALIQKFSDLFQQVFDCKQAYANMVSAAESLSDVAVILSDANVMTPEEAETYGKLAEDLWIAFDEGSYTLEQAQNVELLKNNDLAAQEIDGVYQIATPKNLVWYSALVNSGNCKDAVLTAKIDFASLDGTDEEGNKVEFKFTPIGSAEHPFTGTFDGQGYRISHMRVDDQRADGAVGFFGMVAAPATIKNFVLGTSCYIKGQKFSGLVGQSDGNIEGEIHLEQLGNEGTVEVANQNAGGILGCCMSSKATIFIENCYTIGKIKGANESACISGWIGSNGTVKNCWSISEVEGAQSDATYLYRFGSQSADCTNNWCKGGAQGSTLTDEAVKSGQLCYVLNNGNVEDPIWTQNIGSDSHPVLFGTYIVYNDMGEYTNPVERIAMDNNLKANDGNVYDLTGRLVRKANSAKELQGLKGLYIIGGKKYMIK